MSDHSREYEARLSKTNARLRKAFIELVNDLKDFPGVSISVPPRNKYIVFECKSVKPRRKNFAEVMLSKQHITFWLNRDADYSTLKSDIQADAKRPGKQYALNQKIVLTEEADLEIIKQLLTIAYCDLSGISEEELLGTSIKSEFEGYLYENNTVGSGKASSYLTAIELLERMLRVEPYNFSDCVDIWSVHSLERLIELQEFVKAEAKKGTHTPWHLAKSSSYLKNGYCSAALTQLIEFLPQQQHASSALEVLNTHTGSEDELAKKLAKLEPTVPSNAAYDPTSQDGKDRIRAVKTRIGQRAFREVILDIYNRRCCITGLDITTVNRASHIIGWADRKDTRMDPRNGLCLSATYDAAFDQHLISLDDDYRIILSKDIKEHYSSESVQTYFHSKEGDTITLPRSYLPKKDYLEFHRKTGNF
ncbi:HNH endonuclease [Coraliomargarita sp. W4R53]